MIIISRKKILALLFLKFSDANPVLPDIGLNLNNSCRPIAQKKWQKWIDNQLIRLEICPSPCRCMNQKRTSQRVTWTCQPHHPRMSVSNSGSATLFYRWPYQKDTDVRVKYRPCSVCVTQWNFSGGLNRTLHFGLEMLTPLLGSAQQWHVRVRYGRLLRVWACRMRIRIRYGFFHTVN